MKRRIVTAILFLSLGAIGNIAVAWTLPFFHVTREYSSIGDEQLRDAWTRYAPADWPTDYIAGERYICPWGQFDRIEILPAPEHQGIWRIHVEKLGWPWLTFQGAFRTSNSHFDSVGILDFSHSVPYVPVWPGFAINTLFYAAISWVFFATPFALRRRKRIKRNLCPACAYPVGTHKRCTECGAAVTPIHASGDRASLQSPP